MHTFVENDDFDDGLDHLFHQKVGRRSSASPRRAERGKAGRSLPGPPILPACPPPSSSWRAESSSPDNIARIQQNIEILERKIAAAQVQLSEAERRALCRRASKQRHGERRARLRTERGSSDAASAPSSPLLSALEAAGGGDMPPYALLAVDQGEPPPSPPLQHRRQHEGEEGGQEEEEEEADDETERVDSVVQAASPVLSACAAALRVQRAERGRAARLEVAERAAARGALLDAFLREHPGWRRTPSAEDLQARVLPRLASGARLGAGAFGCVYKPPAAWHFPRDGVAVKAAPLQSAEAAEGLAREAELLRRVPAHPHVVGLHGAFVLGGHARIALDLAEGGDLHDHLWRCRGLLSRPSALGFAAQLAAGLSHLHQHGVAHRDLKLANALLFARGAAAAQLGAPVTLKIGDLGLGVHASTLAPWPGGSSSPPSCCCSCSSSPHSSAATSSSAGRRGVCTEVVGTATTMAPEVVRGDPHEPFAADAWSLGVCVLTLMAPRELDEYDFSRPPFYPWCEADAAADADFAAFADAASRPAPPPPPPSVVVAPPPGLGLPPGLAASLPPGVGVGGGSDRGGTSRASPSMGPSPTASLLAWRERVHGLPPPEPPLHPRLLGVIDALLALSADARLTAADASRQLEALTYL